jgi:hypothetical protein
MRSGPLSLRARAHLGNTRALCWHAASGNTVPTMAPSPWLVGLLFGAGALLGAACTNLQDPQESDSESDSSVDCPIGSVNCRCTNAGTCDPGLVCASDTCTPGSDETGEESSSTSDSPTTDIMTSESSSGSLDECDPEGDGAVDPACGAGTPYCLDGACVDCGGISCAAVSPNLPMCDADTGLCAACDCDEANPVCDAVEHTCSKCSEHDQCPGSACDMWSGACFPLAGALWVDGAGSCDDAASGGEDDPLCTLGEAFTRVQATSDVAHAIRVRPAIYSVPTPLSVPGGGKVALVHATGGDGVVLAAEAQALTVAADASLLVDAIEIRDAGGDGVACAAGHLWLDRLNIAGAGGHGILADKCDLVLRRSVLTGNFTCGASVNVADAHIENSYISKNGNVDGFGGVYLMGGASLDALYTSFIDNYATPGVPLSVACDVDDDPAIESVDVRNSVAINQGTNTLCPGAMVQTTGWSTADAGASNLAILYAELAMYLTEDPNVAGVYRAIEGTELDQLATWVDGDPNVDFDGDPRPNGDNSPDFAGADRVSR